MTTARLFWSGRSQAVRLPKEFRLGDSEINIRREGNLIILEPIQKRKWPTGYFELISVPTEELQLPEDLPPAPVYL
ncbi:MAG: AbrB/MazE/SpoVT family DNA-binding domain-containing protein [Myxococcaceae bacterium]